MRFSVRSHRRWGSVGHALQGRCCRLSGHAGRMCHGDARLRHQAAAEGADQELLVRAAAVLVHEDPEARPGRLAGDHDQPPAPAHAAGRRAGAGSLPGALAPGRSARAPERGGARRDRRGWLDPAGDDLPVGGSRRRPFRFRGGAQRRLLRCPDERPQRRPGAQAARPRAGRPGAGRRLSRRIHDHGDDPHRAGQARVSRRRHRHRRCVHPPDARSGPAAGRAARRPGRGGRPADGAGDGSLRDTWGSWSATSRRRRRSPTC